MVENVDSVVLKLKSSSYTPLLGVVLQAVSRAAFGKGLERHAGAFSFMKQPWYRSAHLFGWGFLLGQADKKISESLSLSPEESINELLDAIVYLGMAIIVQKEALEKTKTRSDHEL